MVSKSRKRKDIFDFKIPLTVVLEDYIDEQGRRVVKTRKGKFVFTFIGEPSPTAIKNFMDSMHAHYRDFVIKEFGAFPSNENVNQLMFEAFFHAFWK
ncbi:hypothetical protein LOZ80_25870 [Paenibacillus sp. HWE-109]|uniref:hypothetical protein n=1 Tax=Paenibacillus sp. HWE-109 TaxID=1306526 RepID=UPI001EE135B9|nr:hypothetical protein [Paenibacillus sp. HWE-109]UKS25009.1 hypothetical protein LOZ80_25870 [Paenibacillus sp. HWE-109]